MTTAQRRGRAALGVAMGLVGIALAGATALIPAARSLASATPAAGVAASPTAKSPDLQIVKATVQYRRDLDLLVFDLQVAGAAGATTPTPRGALDGAPVLGYVVPTNLPPAAVGFTGADGIVALAVTAHPDFDDTPLWDENHDGDFKDDGALWHTHWVLVAPDDRVPGGLAVKAVAPTQESIFLPPTNPGLPLYLDSPGFPVQRDGDTLRVVVPASRVGGDARFNFDAVSAYLQVNASDPTRPMLGVYDVYGILSGDLSLPYAVTQQ